MLQAVLCADCFRQALDGSLGDLARMLTWPAEVPAELATSHKGCPGVCSQESLAEVVGTTRSRVSFFRNDETRRLLATFEACRAKELAAADQLSKPRHSMLYPAYTRLVDALGAVRLKCNDIRLAIRAHRKEL